MNLVQLVHRFLGSGRKVAGAIRPLVNVRGLQVKHARLLHEALLVPVLMYGSKTMIWREKERSGIRVVQMDNLRCLLVIQGMDKVLICRLESFAVTKRGG